MVRDGVHRPVTLCGGGLHGLRRKSFRAGMDMVRDDVHRPVTGGGEGLLQGVGLVQRGGGH